MMGNPAQMNWEKFNLYVIARLPQLQSLDGTEITRSKQIIARQMLPKLKVNFRRCNHIYALLTLFQFQLELEEKATKVIAEKCSKSSYELEATHEGKAKVTEIVDGNDGTVDVEDVDGEEEENNDANEMTDNTPETRVKVNYPLLLSFRLMIPRCLFILCAVDISRTGSAEEGEGRPRQRECS